MATGILNMRFDYDEDNFGQELTNERIKDMVQDSVLSHPGHVYENIDVINEPSPEDGLDPATLNRLENKDPEPRDLASLDVGDVFSLGVDGELFVLTGMEFLGENRDNVWSYASAATGEFEGLLRDGACPDHYAETVYYYNHNVRTDQ